LLSVDGNIRFDKVFRSMNKSIGGLFLLVKGYFASELPQIKCYRRSD